MRREIDTLNKYFCAGENYLAERSLLVNVLASGIGEASGNGQWIGTNSETERRRRMEAAKRWLFSDKVYFNPVRRISFLYICEELCLDATLIRRAVTNNPDSIGDLMNVFRDRSRASPKPLLKCG